MLYVKMAFYPTSGMLELTSANGFLSFIDNYNFVFTYYIKMMYCGVYDYNCRIMTVEKWFCFMDEEDKFIVSRQEKLIAM